MRKLVFVTLISAMLIVGGTASALPVIVDVPSTVAIWLANQPDGTSYYGDTVPQHSPVEIDLTSLNGATELFFHVSGQTSRSGWQLENFPLVGADGECCATGLIPTALVGLFVDYDLPMPSPGAIPDYAHTTQEFSDLSPPLTVAFFIGDGLSGRGTGVLQRFSIPVGADALYLATYDRLNGDNVGSLHVEIVPEPNTALLLGMGLAGLARSSRKREANLLLK